MSDSLVRLRIDSHEFDAKLKTASESLNAYLNKVKKGGGDFRYLDEGVMDCVKAMSQLETKTTSAKSSVSEMTKAFTDLSMTYKRLSEQEKNTEVGKGIKKSLDELKQRIRDTKTDLADINKELYGSKFGDFGNAIDLVGRKLGVTGNITEMVTSKTALMTAGIGASVAIIGKATEALVSYNSELAKQDQITTVTTGLKGDAADNMTNQARALADTYKVDFREAINAANTLMTQFGKSGEESMKLISDGMQGMIQGDGPKLLSMIQQYAPAFRDAGVSASQLVAVIQNSEGGIFTDQNMNAIVMGIKNIRLMTKATSDALAKLGIDGQQMSKQLSDGSMTIFEALKQVAGAIQGVDSNSQAAGEVMQQVFGRQGVTAGTNLGKAIETLNTNLQETKRQTGEVGDAYNDLYEANVRLNKAIREAFEYDGWEQMATGIKAKLVTALAYVIEKLEYLKNYNLPDWLKDPNDKPKPVSNTKVDIDYISRGTTKQERQERYTRVTTNIKKKLSNLDTQEANLGKPYSYTDKNGGLVEQIDTPEQIAKKRQSIIASRQQLNKRLQTIQAQESTLVVEPPKTPTKIEPIYTPTGNTNTKETTEKEVTIQQQIAKLEQEAYTASDERRAEIAKQVQELDKVLAAQKAIRDEVHGTVKEQQMATGISGLTPEMLSWGQADIKKQMQTVELGSEEYNNLAQRLIDYNAVSNFMQEAVKSGLEVDDSVKEYFVEALTGPLGENIPQALYDSLVESLNEFKDYAGENPIEIDTKTGSVKETKTKETEKSDQQLQKITSSMSQVISGLQMVGIKVPESVQTALTVIQGAMTLVQGVSSLISIVQSVSVPSQIAAETANTTASVANTAAITALTAAVWANTASSFIPFANGGVVPHAADGYFVGGNRFSGDLTPIMANAGELILNKTQQSTLADMLTRDDDEGGSSTPYVTGEMIYLGLNNYLKGAGYGELVTTRR